MDKFRLVTNLENMPALVYSRGLLKKSFNLEKLIRLYAKNNLSGLLTYGFTFPIWKYQSKLLLHIRFYLIASRFYFDENVNTVLLQY